MTSENKLGARIYDLVKGIVVVALLIVIAVLLLREQDAATTAKPPPAAPAVSIGEASQQPSDGSISLSGFSEPGSTIQLWAGEIKLGAVPADSDGNWSFEGELDPGDYEIVARTVDADGTVLDESEAVALSVSETAAAVSVPGLNTPEFRPEGGVALSGVAEPGQTVELWAGEVKLGAVSVDSDGNWSFEGELDPGDYEIVARTVDGNGEVLGEAEAVALSVSETAAAPAVPELSAPDLQPEGGVALSGLAEPGSTVELWAGEFQLGAVPVDSDGNWSFEGKLDPGDYEIVARTVDGDGKVVNESEATTVTVVEAGMAPPTLGESQVGDDGTVTLSGTGEPGATIEILEDGRVAGTAVVKEDGSWTFSHAAKVGEHTLAVQAQGGSDTVSAETRLSVAASQAATGRAYIVKRGDWLMKLARRFYGDGRRWRDIYRATNTKAAKDRTFHVIKNPNLIRPGWKLWIPD
jgi:hypothetical protein